METGTNSILILIDAENHRRDCSNSCLLFMYCHCCGRSNYFPGIPEYRCPFDLTPFVPPAENTVTPVPTVADRAPARGRCPESTHFKLWRDTDIPENDPYELACRLQTICNVPPRYRVNPIRSEIRKHSGSATRILQNTIKLLQIALYHSSLLFLV